MIPFFPPFFLSVYPIFRSDAAVLRDENICGTRDVPFDILSVKRIESCRDTHRKFDGTRARDTR